MNKPLTLTISILGILALTSITSASTADVLQPAQTIIYDEDLTVNGTGRFDSIYIGKTTGEGGVTFFNGTMINNSEGSIPLTMGDDLRVDGMIWRGPSKGTSDDMPLKIADTLMPALDNVNDIGTSDNQWKDAYFKGNITVGNLLGSGTVDYSNLDTSNAGSANQILSYNGSELEWVTVGTSSSDSGSSGDSDDSSSDSTITVGDITSVTAGDGLSGGGTEGGVTLNVDDDYVVTQADPEWNSRTGYLNISAAAFQPFVDGYDYENTGYILINSDGASDYFYASVQLPHQAKVTKMDIYWLDSSLSNLLVRLKRIPNSYSWPGDPSENIVSSSSSSNTGDGNSNSTSISNGTINNNSYAYYLYLNLINSNTAFKSCKITYTYTQPY